MREAKGERLRTSSTWPLIYPNGKPIQLELLEASHVLVEKLEGALPHATHLQLTVDLARLEVGRERSKQLHLRGDDLLVLPWKRVNRLQREGEVFDVAQ